MELEWYLCKTAASIRFAYVLRAHAVIGTLVYLCMACTKYTRLMQDAQVSSAFRLAFRWTTAILSRSRVSSELRFLGQLISKRYNARCHRELDRSNRRYLLCYQRDCGDVALGCDCEAPWTSPVGGTRHWRSMCVHRFRSSFYYIPPNPCDCFAIQSKSKEVLCTLDIIAKQNPQIPFINHKFPSYITVICTKTTVFCS